MNGRGSEPVKVLLVEDDPGWSAQLLFRLTHETSFPASVKSVPNLAEGLSHLRHESADLVLLDLSLPDSSGTESLQKIRDANPEIPVVILTGWDDDRLAVESLRLGAEDYVVKGEVEWKVIHRVLQNAIERHRIKRELALVTRALQDTNQRLERMTLLDPLTELYNRRGVQQALAREIQWAIRHDWSLLAIIVDVDDFKRINDTLGYAVGDIVLREIASALKKSVRLTDHVGRIGGDEFLILLPGTDLEEGGKIADRIRLLVANTMLLLSQRKREMVTVSLGLAPVPRHALYIDEMLALLHPLLRRSKTEGKNRLTLGGMKEPCVPESTSLQDPVSILMSRQFYRAVRQPIFYLPDRRPVGYEFLSRLDAETCPLPDDFFHLAMENNMLTLVDRNCFKTCALAAQSADPSLACHLNVLPSTLVDISVDQLLRELPEDPGARTYCFEISEQQLIGDPAYLLDSVEAFKRAGIRIAFDDVGFGHTSLESILAFEPDIFKLDRKFVSGIAHDSRRLGPLRKLVKIASYLNAQLVAEGIETAEDLETLLAAGVVYGQGFLLGKPQ